jgi:hypothetical protein
MAIDWKVLRPEHVSQACEIWLTTATSTRVRGKGLVVRYRNRELPAKAVLQLAYRVAKGLPMGAEVRFASGDGTIRLLKSLGFEAGRSTGSEMTGEQSDG